MKPHEETWALYQSGKENHGIYRVSPAFRRTIATRIGTYDEAMLLSAAPEMARALLDHVRACSRCDGTGVVKRLESEHDCPDCSGDRAILTKAGVLT